MFRSEEEAWDFKYPVDPNFFWQTQEGDIVHPSEMTTWHLFNCLRMIWNHTVRLDYRIHPYRRYRNIDWPREQIYRAIQNLFNELMNRPDRAPRMEQEIAYMKQVVFTYGIKMLR